MALLEDIISNKRKEIASNKELNPVKLLEKSSYFSRATDSLKKTLLKEDKVGIIAEFKRRSPSRGTFNENLSIEKISTGYIQAGASALSVLTDSKYFGGKNEDLTIARKFNSCPILRKDFVLDEYQILEAKSIGADVVLLIARILTPKLIKNLTKLAKTLGLEVLLEVHSEKELNENLCPEIEIVGVNNRNLDTLTMDTSLSKDLATKIPKELMRISESGIDSAELILDLKKIGYSGFLIGESFMKTNHPEKTCAQLVVEIIRHREKNAY